MSAILNSPALAVLALLVCWVLAYGPPDGWRRRQESRSTDWRTPRH